VISHVATALLVAVSFVGNVPGEDDCVPPKTVKDVLDDPGVQDQLDDAWRDSNEGADDEHEEGGWILQCTAVNSSGQTTTTFVVVRWPPGTSAGITPSPVPQRAGCRLWGEFHTHPGPEEGHPQDDGNRNQIPSDTDVRAANRRGVPGIIRYGTGSDPANTTTFTYPEGRTKPTGPAEWTCP
jgi:hypothetical protein